MDNNALRNIPIPLSPIYTVTANIFRRMCKFISASSTSSRKNALKDICDRTAKESLDRDEEIRCGQLPRTVCLGSETRNANYKLTTTAIAIFSRDYSGM